MNKTIATASCMLFAAVLAAPAQAGAKATTKHVTVSYSDLDLSRATGAAILLSRLRSASRQVCGGEPDLREYERIAIYRSCYQDAMDNAVGSVNRPVVAELYGKPITQEQAAAVVAAGEQTTAANADVMQSAVAAPPKVAKGNRILSYLARIFD